MPLAAGAQERRLLCPGMDNPSPVDALRQHAHAAARRPTGPRPAASADRRCTLRVARRGVARHARVLCRARRDHAPADRGTRLRRGRHRRRLARHVPAQSFRARRRRRSCGGRSPHRLPALSHLDVAQHRHGGVHRLAARVQPAAQRGSARRHLRARPVQPAHVDDGGDGLPGAHRPSRCRTGALALCVLRPFRRRHAALQPAGRTRRDGLVPAAGVGDAGRHAAPHREALARSVRRGGGVRCLAERAPGQQRRGLLPLHRVPQRRVVVEPARPPHGRDAGRARTPHRPRRPSTQDRGVGAQLAPGRRARHRDGPAARRAQPRPAGAPAPWRALRAGGLHHARRPRDGRQRLGRATRTQGPGAGTRRQLRAACCMPPACRSSCCRCATLPPCNRC